MFFLFFILARWEIGGFHSVEEVDEEDDGCRLHLFGRFHCGPPTSWIIAASKANIWPRRLDGRDIESDDDDDDEQVVTSPVFLVKLSRRVQEWIEAIDFEDRSLTVLTGGTCAGSRNSPKVMRQTGK